MKHFIFIGLSLAFLGCRKSYTCECTANDASYNTSQTLEMTKSAAEDWCIDQDLKYTLDNETSVPGWKCELKY